MSRYIAGEHFLALDTPAAIPAEGAEEAQVTAYEFFVYSCPHCYDVEEEVDAWRDSLDDGVVFERVPMLFGRQGERYARLFYTAKTLGVLDDVHDEIFVRIHERGERLLERSDIKAFLVEQGVDGDRFDAVFEGDTVNAAVARADRIMRAYKVRATPSLGVDGRFYISGRTAGGNDAMFDVADFLVRRRLANDAS